ncbi:hypothetical protein JCM10908_004409 [Rhodotorula pacifica]|uniref:uncharacterized protein n=1 Tax=Rhodotorula pacifica TaxID=1495444 RepID=UPI00316B54E1
MSLMTCTSALVLALSLVDSVSALPASVAPVNVKNAASSLPATAAPEDSFWIPAGPAYRVPEVRFYNYTGGAFTGGREPTPSVSLVMPSYPASSSTASSSSTATATPPSPTKRKRSRVSLSDTSAVQLQKRDTCLPPRSPARKLITLLQAAAQEGALPVWRLGQLNYLESRYALAAGVECTSAPTSTAWSSTTTITTKRTPGTSTTTSASTSSPRPITTTTQKPKTTTTTVKTTTTTSSRSSTTTTTTRPSPTPSPTSATSWKQKTWFYSLAPFLEYIVDKQNWSWGDNDVAVVGKGVPAKEWTNGIAKDTESALQVASPKGSRNPSAKPVGGMGFYSSKLDIAAAHNVSFSYSVFFPTDFDFVKGGKLPGLYGGAKACSGGSAAQSCWSARLMFRTNGMGELYLYAPREKQVDALCTLGPLSFCNSVYGMSIGRGSWTFKRGEWSNIRQDIWLNTPGKPDGGFNIWVNNKLVLHSNSVYYRNTAAGLISNGTGTGPDNLPLIDYDALPDNLEIPNGGFKTNPLGGLSSSSSATPAAASSSATSLAPPTSDSSSTGDAAPTAAPPAQRRSRRIIDSLFKRKMLTVPGFNGAMVQTFFGGSTASWNSPKLQYSYFRGLKMQIN